MGFSAKQLRALKRPLNPRVIRTRLSGNRELSYIEGWYAISEANRIFGFGGWSRETLESKSVLARETRGTFLAIYLARVRITVKVRGVTVIREGHGTGEGRGPSPQEVHDIALKTAETDATKRALATFGRPFGLELYRNVKVTTTGSPPLAPAAATSSLAPDSRIDSHSGLHPDDTTPIPRPSRYYGLRSGPSMLDTMRQDQQPHELSKATSKVTGGATTAVTATAANPVAPSPAPASTGPNQRRIDKSQLALGEPKRLRDKAHLKSVASQPCLICGRQPCDPHHLRFAQPRAIGLKVSDEFTVPLCRGHHRQLHQVGNEVAWWENLKIKPLEIAKELWQQTHRKSDTADAAVLALPNSETKPIVPAARS
jgi:hypothetical protein